MKASAGWLGAALTSVALLAAGVGARAESLTVASNGGALSAAEKAAFYDPFGKAHNLEVVGDSFNQELAKLRTQVDTGNLQWDVVSLTAINEATACEEGLIEKIDWAKQVDAKDFEGVGGFGKCGIPYNFISGGLVYDADKIKDGPKSWADFWNVQKWPGKRGLLYRAEQTFEVALMADGVAPRDATKVLSGPGGVDRALKKLGELKPSIHWWKAGDESMQILLTGEVAMSYGWNGRVAAANKANHRNLKIEFGAGHVSGSQYFCIMKGTKRKDTALAFIRYAVSPEPEAAFSREIAYAPANEKAYALLSADVKATLPAGHLDRGSLQGGKLYDDFWLSKGDSLLQQFVKFAAQ
ncbi:MAG TPA: ABC transporter substrate-binding protein [Candidatus Sulfotelmatobacter sp.]|nr:ABC transporter substrate-binding protein [Candidatus Sulfotelmatobacter sp.]